METYDENGNLIVPDPLFILPMRNGNQKSKIELWKTRHAFYPTYEEWKLTKGFEQVQEVRLFILPMRNGNLEVDVDKLMTIFAFYPTYEEWKPGKGAEDFAAILTFYPTYEEWKP